jgi:apolipoprotein N-acyltransferase
LLASAAGGALLGLTFPEPGFTLLGWVSLVPLYVRANASARRREAATASFLAGMTFHLVAFNWIYATCRYAGIPAPAAAFVLLLLASFQALPWALAGYLGRLLTEEKARVLRPFVWAAVWTAVFAACERWTPRMPADLLANTQWSNLPLLQSLSWGGPQLLGFVVALVNAALAEAWLDAREPRPGPSVAPLACGIGAAALLTLHGAWTLIRKPAPGPCVPVEILHPGVDQYEKWDRARSGRVWGELGSLLDAPRAAAPSLTVWPETSVPRWGADESVAVPEAAEAAKRSAGPQLVGLVSRSPEGPHNAAQLIAPDGRLDGVYRKRERVPFGEYVPFRGLIPRFAVERWFDVLDRFEDIDAGDADQTLLPTAWGKASVTICYEALFPRWALRDARRGARLIVNMTNDGWYPKTWEPAQHFHVNRLRAVETRSWLVRSANIGLSGVISPWGEVVSSVPEHVRTRLDAAVPTTDHWPEGSWYVRHGDIVGSLCLLLVAVLSVLRAFTLR